MKFITNLKEKFLKGKCMSNASYDLAVIGGGPGGYVAAIRASQLGLNVVVIEREKLGGICLNWGCIPTKALLRSCEVYHLLSHADQFGLSVSDIGFDFDKIVARSRKVSQQLSGGIAYLMKKNKIAVIEGSASLKGKGVISITDKSGEVLDDVTASNIILATGARAKTLPGLEPDGELIWDYRTAMTAKSLPKSLLVVGSGAIGMEFASFYHSLGVDVHVVEIAGRILPVEDKEISEQAKKAFQSSGMNIHTNCTAELDKQVNQVAVNIISDDGASSEIVVDRVISAVGITANVENLGLETVGVELARGHVVTDQWCSTSVKGVFAIGDVAGAPWLAHKASHEAVICVEKIAGVTGVKPLNSEIVPGCTYCTPQIASVGLTEEQAREKGYSVDVGKFPFQANGKAIALGEPVGMVKTIFDSDTGRLLGAHMIGAEVTELIQGYCIAIGLKATADQLAHIIFPHPTLSEMMHESVLDSQDKAIHM